MRSYLSPGRYYNYRDLETCRFANLPPIATRVDILNHFESSRTRRVITEVKLMDGFGFIEYLDAVDARDAVPSMSIMPNA